MTDRNPIKSHAAFSLHYESSSESSSDGFRLNSASSSETIRPSTAGSSTDTLKPGNEESLMSPSRQEILLSGSDWSQDRHSDISTSGWSSIDGDNDYDREAAVTVTKCLLAIDKLLFGEEISNEDAQFVTEEVEEECKLWRENFTYLRLSGIRVSSQNESSGFEYFHRAALENYPDEKIDLPCVNINSQNQLQPEYHPENLEFNRPDETICLEGRKIIPKVPASSAVYAEEMIECNGIVEELIASDRNEIAAKVKKRPKSSSDFDGKIKYYQIKSDEPLTPDLPDTRVIYERPNQPARAATVLSNAPSTARPFQSTRNASRASGDYRGQLNSKQNQDIEIQLQQMMQKGISSLRVKGSSHSLDSRMNINRESTDVFPSLKIKESFLNRPATTQSRQRDSTGSRNQARANNASQRMPMKKHRLEPIAPKSRLQSRQNYDKKGLDQLMGHSISQKELSKSYSSIESRVSPTNNTSSSRLFSRPSDTLVRIPESRPDEYPIKHSVSSRHYDHSGIDGRSNFSQASRRQPLTIANQVSKMNIIQGIEGKPPPQQKRGPFHESGQHYHHLHRHHHM